MAESQIATVRRMLDAWEAFDVDAILAAMTPDVRYHNVPLPLLEGQDAVRGWVVKFLAGIASFKVEYCAEVESADLVFNERVDIVGYPDGRTAPIRIAGVFRFREGLICDWRDYFDLAEFRNNAKQQGPTGGRA